jgi:hypothetical protein
MTVHVSVWIWPAAFAVWLLGVALGAWAGLGIGRDRGYDAGYDDGRGDEQDRASGQLARRQARRGERTAAFLNPPEVHHEALVRYDTSYDHPGWEADDDPTVSAWTQQMAESMDAWLQEHVYGVPIPYLPGEDRP